MLTPYQNLCDRVGALEHGFVKKYGARIGFRMTRHIRVKGYRVGEPEHIGWFVWNGTKRDLRRLIESVKDSHPFYEDMALYACVSRSDVKRDPAFEEDVTSLVSAIDAGQ